MMRGEIVAAAERAGKNTITYAEAEGLLRAHGVMHSTTGWRSTSFDERPTYAVEAVVERLVDMIDVFLLDLPPSLGCEIIESGIRLTGGGALIPGIRERLEERTGIGVTIADNPRTAVVEGARVILPVVTALNQW
jgi:rod shape-determining protein MreB